MTNYINILYIVMIFIAAGRQIAKIRLARKNIFGSVIKATTLAG
jgi:hypothetical protein